MRKVHSQIPLPIPEGHNSNTRRLRLVYRIAKRTSRPTEADRPHRPSRPTHHGYTNRHGRAPSTRQAHTGVEPRGNPRTWTRTSVYARWVQLQAGGIKVSGRIRLNGYISDAGERLCGSPSSTPSPKVYGINLIPYEC